MTVRQHKVPGRRVGGTAGGLAMASFFTVATSLALLLKVPTSLQIPTATSPTTTVAVTNQQVDIRGGLTSEVR